MREDKCKDCPKRKTLVRGWVCCMGNSCEIDVRNKTIDEIGMKLCAEIYFGYEVKARVLEILEQMKEQK